MQHPVGGGGGGCGEAGGEGRGLTYYRYGN